MSTTSRFICTSFTTPSPATALRAFAAAVEDTATVGGYLGGRGGVTPPYRPAP